MSRREVANGSMGDIARRPECHQSRDVCRRKGRKCRFEVAPRKPTFLAALRCGGGAFGMSSRDHMKVAEGQSSGGKWKGVVAALFMG